MIFLAITAAIIAAIFPFAGMIFTIYFGAKFQSKIYVFFSAFIGTAIALYFSQILDPIRILDLIIGIGLVSFVFIRSFISSYNYLYSLMKSSLIAIFYAIVRQILFFETIKQTAETVLKEYNAFITDNFSGNLEQAEIMRTAVESTKLFLTKYYAGLWSSVIILAIFIAALLISYRSNIKWKTKYIRLPFATVYILILALILSLIPNAQEYGLNGLIIIAPFFLIQGTSILTYFWSDFFKQSKFLSLVLVAFLLINPYLMILITLIGLFDIWFNFRKINNGG